MLVKYVLGPYVAMASCHCYAIAADVEQVTLQHFGYPKKKLSVQSLGVDTNLFRPVQDLEDERQRQSLRFHLGISADEVVYIYTGRFSSDKAPLLLAKAVDLLRQRGNPVRAVFIGSGAKEDVDSIRQRDGCIVLPFMPVSELPHYYRMADVGVWPKQESTSQLDALACGLPLVLSDRVQARDRIEGCGYTYKDGEHDSLAGAMLQLMSSEIRAAMGTVGAKRVRDLFSWTHIAKTRFQDYEQALAG
jgi:glycosyltransferase involved in cell wall biosynthesis